LMPPERLMFSMLRFIHETIVTDGAGITAVVPCCGGVPWCRPGYDARRPNYTGE
jgi:hypothetical protein